MTWASPCMASGAHDVGCVSQGDACEVKTSLLEVAQAVTGNPAAISAARAELAPKALIIPAGPKR